MSANPAFKVSKSFKEGCVSVRTNVQSGMWNSSVRVEARATITTDEARALAADLIAACDAADAKVAKRLAENDRREAWRQREIAAGRLEVLTAKEFFGRKED